MNRVLTVFFMGCLLPLCLVAQKIKLESETAKIRHIQLPIKPLEDVKTYETMITYEKGNLWASTEIKKDWDEKYLKLYGYQHAQRNGDLIVEMVLGRFKIVNEEKLEAPQVVSLSKSTNKSKGRFSYQFSYKMPYKVLVTRGDELILSTAPTEESVYTFKSPSFKNWEEAEANKRRNKNKWIREIQGERFKKMAEYHNGLMNYHFGYKPITAKFDLMYPNPDKAPDYKNVKEEVTAMTQLLAKIQAKQAISDSVRLAAGTLMDKWKEAANAISVEDKQLSKLKRAYIHNLAYTNYYLENFQEATDFANILIEEKLSKSTGKDVLRSIEELKAKYEKVTLDTRHFEKTVELSEEEWANITIEEEEEEEKGEFQNPNAKITVNTDGEVLEDEEAETLEEKRTRQLKLNDKTKEYEGSVTRRGKTIEGVFVIDYTKYSIPVFFEGGNIRFYENTAEEGEEDNFEHRYFVQLSTDEFKFADRVFTVIPQQNKLLASVDFLTHFVLERVAGSPETFEVFVEHPSIKEDLETQSLTGNFWMKKADDKKYQNISDNFKYMNFKKSVSKYLSDCPSLAEKIKKGELKRNLTDLVQIAEEYEDCEK